MEIPQLFLVLLQQVVVWVLEEEHIVAWEVLVDQVVEEMQDVVQELQEIELVKQVILPPLVQLKVLPVEMDVELQLEVVEVEVQPQSVDLLYLLQLQVVLVEQEQLLQLMERQQLEPVVVAEETKVDQVQQVVLVVLVVEETVEKMR